MRGFAVLAIRGSAGVWQSIEVNHRQSRRDVGKVGRAKIGEKFGLAATDDLDALIALRHE